jgi:hypothetical protein
MIPYSISLGQTTESEGEKEMMRKIDEYNIGEIYDLFCVSNDNKPLALLHFSSDEYINKNKVLINKIIEYANLNSVKGLYFNDKTIFYKSDNEKNAITLMGIIKYPLKYTKDSTEYHVMVGLLLGYSVENIIYFIKLNYNSIITNDKVSLIKDTLDNLEMKLEYINFKKGVITSL